MKCVIWCGVVIGLAWSNVVLAAAVQVTDSRGKVIRLSQPAESIVALAPHMVENAYSAGAGAYVVAAVDYSDFPESAKALPKVGSYNNVNYEAILALKPQLVLAWASGNGPKVVQQLERFGINVYVGEVRDIKDIASEVRHIGILAGTTSTAESVAQKWLETMATLQQRYASLEPVSVFYQVWNDPLQTLNGEHLISKVITMCGGHNIFSDAAGLAPKISVESVLHRDPAVIIASGMGSERPEWLEDWKQYPLLQAVKSKHLYFVPPDLIQRHSMRISMGAAQMCRHVQQASRSP